MHEDYFDPFCSGGSAADVTVWTPNPGRDDHSDIWHSIANSSGYLFNPGLPMAASNAGGAGWDIRSLAGRARIWVASPTRLFDHLPLSVPVALSCFAS